MRDFLASARCAGCALRLPMNIQPIARISLE
jgi:hypothetical protein